MLQWGKLHQPSNRAQYVSFPRTFGTIYSLSTGYGHPTNNNWKPESYPTVANMISNSGFYMACNDGTRVDYYYMAIGKS